MIMKNLNIDDEIAERLVVEILKQDYKDRVLEPEWYTDSPESVLYAYQVLLNHYMNGDEKKAFAQWHIDNRGW